MTAAALSSVGVGARREVLQKIGQRPGATGGKHGRRAGTSLVFNWLSQK
jgi:hypothetical protein